MYTMRFRYRFEAAHRFTQTESLKCSTPHGHSWYATLALKSLQEGRNPRTEMVEEFSTLKSEWKRFVEETLDHSFFHHHQDPILSALKEHVPDFRGLAFPGDPTTELIAALLFKKARALLSSHSGFGKSFEVHSIILEETPTNTIVYENEVKVGSDDPKQWWNDSNPESRNFFI